MLHSKVSYGDLTLMTDYTHGPRLTGGELLVLKHKARSLVCPEHHYCEDIECYRGHHCKYGKRCPLEKCYFADTHHMDMVCPHAQAPGSFNANKKTEAG